MSAVLALLASLVWGTSDFIGGLVARRLPVRVLVLCSQAVGLLTLVVVSSVFGLWRADAASLGWGVLGGTVSIVALGAFYRGLALGPMSIVSPVASVGVLVPFVGGLLRGEDPRPWQLAGALVAIVGVVVAARPADGGPDAGRHLVAVGLGLAAALGFGVVLLAVQEGAGGSVAMTLVGMRLTGVGLLGLLALGTVSTRWAVPRWPLRGDLGVIVVVGTFDLAANGLFAVAGRGGLLSVTAVLSSLYPLVTALLAWRVTGEHLGRLQTGGVGLALVGVLLLAA